MQNYYYFIELDASVQSVKNMRKKLTEKKVETFGTLVYSQWKIYKSDDLFIVEH